MTITPAARKIEKSMAGGDANGEGVPDVLGGYAFDEAHRPPDVAALGRPKPERCLLSASTAQPMTVDADPASTGRIYWMAGSFSGKHPDTP